MAGEEKLFRERAKRMKNDDGLEPIEGVNIKTEIRLTLLIAVCFVGFVVAVRMFANWIAG